MQNLLVWIVAAAVYFMLPDDVGLGSFVGELLIALALVVVVTPVAVYAAVLKSLPENVEVSRAPGSFTPELKEHIAAYEALGFVRVGDPLRFHVAQEALLVPLLKADEAMVATVYVIKAATPKVGYDVVSFFDAPDCSLTTAMDHGAGVLPASDGQLRQIFRNASPDELVERHRKALRFLNYQRLPLIDASGPAIPSLLKLSFQVNRETFLKAKVANTFTALWRTLTKGNPHMKPLSEQDGIEEHVRAIPRRKAVTRPRALVS